MAAATPGSGSEVETGGQFFANERFVQAQNMRDDVRALAASSNTQSSP
jgi:hypothetical protein